MTSRGAVYDGLAAAVATARYRDWEFWLTSGRTLAPMAVYAISGGTMSMTRGNCVPPVLFAPLLLRIMTVVPDSRDPAKMIAVGHLFEAPPVQGTDWERWVLDCVIAVETHEICEVFEVGGRKAFYPAHGGEGNPYEVRKRD